MLAPPNRSAPPRRDGFEGAHLLSQFSTTPTYTTHAAKTNLSKHVAPAEAGEEVVLARGKDPVMRIVAVASKPKRQSGRLKGKGSIELEFFEPLPESELKVWE